MVQIMALSNDEAVPTDNSIQNLFQPDLYYEVGQEERAKSITILRPPNGSGTA